MKMQAAYLSIRAVEMQGNSASALTAVARCQCRRGATKPRRIANGGGGSRGSCLRLLLLFSLLSISVLAQSVQAVGGNQVQAGDVSDVKTRRHGDVMCAVGAGKCNRTASVGGDRKGARTAGRQRRRFPELDSGSVQTTTPGRNRTRVNSTVNGLEEKITNRRSLLLDGKQRHGILLERTNLATDFDSTASPVLHIHLASVEEAVGLLEELDGRYSVTLDHRAPGESSEERVHFEINDSQQQQQPANRTTTNRVTTTTTTRPGSPPCAARAPRWIKRGNVCKKEVHRFHGFTKRLLDLVHTSRNCRSILDRFVCVDSFGSGEFAPTKITTVRCCDGFKLTLNRAFCRRKTDQPVVNKPARRRPIARRRRPQRPNTRQRPKGKFPNRVVFKPSRPTRIGPGPGSSSVVDRHLFRPRTSSNYTTFVPNDQILENDVGEDGIVEEIFDNLVIADQLLLSENLRNNDIYSAISGNPVRFNFFSNRAVMTVNCMSVSSRDYRPDFDQANHIYHVIEGLLAHIRTTIAGYLQQRPQVFSTLINALTRLDMLDELDDESNSMTLFAPINEAFEMLTTDVASESDSCLRELVESHVIDQVYCSPASAMEILLRTRNNKTLHTTYDAMFSTSYVNGSELIKADVMTYNGVIHFLPSTLYRVRTLEDVLQSLPQLTAFYEVVRTMNMIDRLAKLRNVTLVAPYNSAFEALSASERIKIMKSYREWARRLHYHMIESRIDLQAIRTSSSTNLHRLRTSDGANIAHVTRYPIKLRVADDGSGKGSIVRKMVMAFQCARISSRQLVSDSCAGSILTTDQIPKRSASSLLTIMEDTHAGNFSIFLQLIRQAGLEERFSRATDFTLFAPTNHVFARFSTAIMNKFFGEREMAQKIILFHLIPGFKCREELMQTPLRHRSVVRQHVVTCPKREILLVGRNRKKMRSRVVLPDLLADNGIIHGINNLLLYRVASNHQRKL